MEGSDAEGWLDRWIHMYVSDDPHPSNEAKARFPLRQARISVYEGPAKAGRYRLAAWLQPWLPLEELQAPVKLDAEIPHVGGA
jgi:type VI secretion system protein ImpC